MLNDVVCYFKRDNESLIKQVDQIDCSELADWFVAYLKDSGMYGQRICIEADTYEFKVEEFGKELDVTYHYVVQVGEDWVDVRHSTPVMLMSEYKKKLEGMNKGKDLYYTLED